MALLASFQGRDSVMLSRMGIVIFCLGFTVGVIAFGCASASRRSQAV